MLAQYGNSATLTEIKNPGSVKCFSGTSTIRQRNCSLLKIPKNQRVPTLFMDIHAFLIAASLTFDFRMRSGEQLVFDVGNTRIKGGRFQDSQLLDIFYIKDANELISLMGQCESRTIVSSVVLADTTFDELPENKKPIFLSSQIDLPIAIDYDTPETLGVDRLAAAVGGFAEFPNENLLIIDLGTCNTYDVINRDGVYLGGVIAPGYKMRMRSMHQMTGRLPDITEDRDASRQIPGKSTRECMHLGSKDGMLMEINGFIEHFKKEFDVLRVIVTGGNASSFESFIKPPIFVRPEIVLVGLHRILEHHEAD